MTLAERIAQQLGVKTDRYMFGLFGDEKSGAGGFGKLQILGKTKHVTRCQNCGRAGLKHAVVCAVVGEDGHPTNQYYYFGSDCASKLAGKAEKDIDAEAEEQEQAGRPRMKKLKPVKPNEGQMELGLRFAAQWHSLLVERYGRPKPAKGQMGLDFDALSSSAQPTPQPQEVIPAVTTQQPAAAPKGRQMGLFEQPAAAETVSKPAGFEEQKHPRWEAGDKQHHGGQFAPKEHKPHKHGQLESAENVLERVKSSPNQPKERDWGKYASQFGIEGDFKHVDVPTATLKQMIDAGHLRISQSIDPDEVGKKARSGQRNPVVVTNEPGRKGLVVEGNHSLQAALKAGDETVKAIVPASHALAVSSPKESKGEAAIENPPFRDFRYVPKHRNAGSLYPNRPGQIFTDEQQQQLKNWARQNGMMVSSDSGPGAIHIVHNDHRARLDLTLHGAEGVKREAVEAKSKQAAEQESARKQQAEADLAGRGAAGFISEAFGDSLNTYNKTKLADFLEGKDKKFGGLWSRAHVESLQKLGAIDSTGQVNFDAIRKAFEQHGKAATGSGPQEPAKPDLHAIAAEARAAGGNLWVTSKKHGIGITHPQASELAKVFQAMGEAEKPKPGMGQLRGQAKFAEARAQEEPKAQYFKGDEIRLTGKADGDFEEFEYLEGHKKGQTGLRLSPAASEAQAKQKQQEWKDQQVQFARLHDKQPEPKAEGKEPWQMTRAEFQSDPNVYDMTGLNDTEAESRAFIRDSAVMSNAEAARRHHVRVAIREGKSVPAEVLADYPELQKPAPAAQPAESVPSAGGSLPAPKQDDFEGLVDEPVEAPKPSDSAGHAFGELVKAPDGTAGIMRGSNGLGGNRAGVINHKGQLSWHNRDELKRASEADLPEGKTLADMPTSEKRWEPPQQPAKPEPEAPKSAGSNIEYRVRHDLPPKERIARYLRAHLKPGDEISVGGNSTLKIKRINPKSVTTESGGTWEYGSFKPVGLDLAGMSEKLEEFEKMGGLEAHLLRSTTAKAIKSAILKSDSDPLSKTLTEEGLKQVREAKTAHLGFVAEQLAKVMPGMDRAAIRQAILDHRKAAGVVEDEAGERKGPIQVAVKSQVPTVDEIEHALQHIESNETGTRFIERNPDTGEVRWAHHENKNSAVNNFINRQRSKLAPNDYVRVRGNYKSWLKSHGTDENKLLGVDPKAAKAKQQEAMSKASMTLADFAQHMNDLDDGKVTADQHKAAFARFRDSLPGLEAEISKMKKDDIEGWTHEPGMRIMGRQASKKAEAVQDLLRRMKSSFDVKGETNRWTYGQDREKQLHDAVAGITDDHIKEYTEGVAQVRAERAERQKKREESLANPQTFEDWKRKAVMSGGWEKLSPEHQAAYDESYAQLRREKHPSKLEKPREVSAFSGGQEKTGEVGIVKGHHQKRNAPTWTVTVQEHLGDSWKEALIRAKQLGGNYVNARIARAYGATPGFQFFDEEAAKKFHAVLGGQAVDNSDKIEARAAERAENVAGKLADLSERLAERGEDSLNRERKDNTARRARMAGNAEDDARKQLAKSKTLAKVAEHITSGKAVHLKHVANGAQVDQLDKLLYRSQINAIQKRQRAGERVSEDDWERPASLEDIAHAEYPYPYLHKSELRDQAAALAGVPGLKLFAAKLGKMAAEMPYDKDYAQIKDLGDLEKIQEAIPKMRRHPDHNVRRIASRFGEKLEDMNRLQRMDIRSTPELRAALREYHTMKQEPEGRDPLKEHLRYLKRQKIDGFFPTPPPLIEKMLDHADIGDGMSVLEPSAGIGSIMAAIRENHPDAELHGIEQDRDIAKALELQGLPHERGDFLQHTKQYDRIVMNPPFENRQDEKHVKHAFGLLKPGGRLVAIMGAGAHQNERSAGFRDWLSLMGGKVYDTPEGSFAGDDAFRQTGVATKMVIIDKPVEETERHSLADDARELGQRVRRIVERYSAGQQHPSFVRKVTDTSNPEHDNQNLGSAAWTQDGHLNAIHVTNNHAGALKALQAGDVTSHNKDSHEDLGAGLYASAVPHYWRGRATNRWDFLPKLKTEQVHRLADHAIGQLQQAVKSGYNSESEANPRIRELHDLKAGKLPPAALQWVADQPYNIDLANPLLLKEHGIDPGQQPEEVHVKAQGKFAELNRQISHDERKQLEGLGFHGAYITGGMHGSPQVVIWDHNAIKKFGNYEHKPQPKPALNLFGEPVKPASKAPASFDAAKAKQGILFAGLNAKEGQMNLFADAGVPDDLVAKPQGPEQKELFSAIREAIVERYAADGPKWIAIGKSAFKFGKYRVQKGDDNLWYHTLHHKNGLQSSSAIGFRSAEEAKQNALKQFEPPEMRQVTEGPAKGNWEIVPKQPRGTSLPVKSQVPEQKDLFSAVREALIERYGFFDGLQSIADNAAKKVGNVVERVDQAGKKLFGQTKSFSAPNKPSQPKSKLAVRPSETGVKAGAPLIFNADHSMNGGESGFPKGTQGKLVGGHEDPSKVVVDVNGQHHAVPKSVVWHDTRHTDHKAVEKSQQEAQQAQAERAQKFANMTARQQAEAIPEGAEKAKRITGNFSSHDLQEGDIIHHGLPGLPPFGRVISVSADKSGNPDGKHVVIETAMRSKSAADGIATTGQRATIPGHEKIGEAVASRSFPVQRMPDEAKPIGQRKQYQQFFAQAKSYGFDDDTAHNVAMDSWNQANPKPKSAESPKPAVKPATGPAAASADPKPRHHVSSLQKGDVLSYLSGAEKGQRVRFVSRSDKPGHVIVNTPEKGNHELPVRSLGLYSSPVLTPFTKARAASLIQKNDGMQPQEAIRQARLERGNRRAPDVHQIPRSEFAQYRHGILAKDKQGNGFLLHGGKRYPLSPAEFDGNKLISDPVKIRERIHRDQVKSVAASNPNVVPPHVRDEYDHHWSEWTGNSPFAKSGAKASAAPTATATEPAATTEPSPEGKKGSTLIGMPLNTPAGNAGVGRNTPAESRFGEWKGDSPVGKGGRILKGMNQNPQDESSVLPSLPIQGMAINRPDGSPPEAAGQSAAAPEAQPAPQPPKRNLASITRPFNAGANRAMIQFDNELQRDLHDLAAARSFKLKHSGNVDGRQPKSQQALNVKLSQIANQHFGGDEDAASLAAMETLNHVKRHMKGVQDGEHRIVPPLGVEVPKPATPSSQPKQKLQASIGKAIAEARNSDAGGKHQLEHEILRSMPVNADAFPPDVLPQVVQMVKDHIGEFHAPRRMEAEKLAKAWENARGNMGIPKDLRTSKARQLLKQMRGGEIDASSKQLKGMDLIAAHLRQEFPNRFSNDPAVRDEQVMDFLTQDRPSIPQPHDFDLVNDFWLGLHPSYAEGLEAIAKGAPFNREEWGELGRHMPPPDDWNDFNHFSASGDSIVDRFSAVWSTKEFFNGQGSYGKRSGFAANRSGKAKKGSA